jgi:hypothetical protein
MDATNLQGQALDWTLLDDTASDTPSVTSGVIDLGDNVSNILSLVVAHADVNAAGANIVTMKVYAGFGIHTPATNPYEEELRLVGVLTAGGGTAVKEDISGTSNANQKEITVADTTDWDTGLGERLFILDANPVNSEIVTIAGWHDNTHYNAMSNLSNTHLNTSDLLDGVTEQTFELPKGARYFKVDFFNSDDDATYYVRCDYIAVTDYE